MIARKHRFHGHASLRYVYQHGQVIRGPLFSIKYVPNERRKMYRAAVVVSKKVNKSAVVRNRIRRRIYEIIRHLEPAILRPHDIVVTVFSENVAEVPYEELEIAVRAQMRQAHIVAPKQRS